MLHQGVRVRDVATNPKWTPVSDAERPTGAVAHVDRWWDHDVDLDFHFLDPAEVAAWLTAAGFTVMARTDREPWPGVEHPSRRSYLLAVRDALR